MKKLILSFFALAIVTIYSCSGLKNMAYSLTEKDAAAAIRQLLQFGSREGLDPSAFSRQALMQRIIPGELQTPVRLLQTVGLTGELDKMMGTVETAATKTAERSIPIFEQTITRMNIHDAMRLVKQGGTSATDYLRMHAGDSLRRAIQPVMQEALATYKADKYWEAVKKPLQSVLGSNFNPDLATIMSAFVTEVMFNKIAEKEKQVRADASARQTELLQKVFSKDWN